MFETVALPSTKRLTLNLEFPMGSTVYLRLRQERMAGMVTGITVWPTGLVYRIAWGDSSETTHFEMELADAFEPNFEVTD